MNDMEEREFDVTVRVRLRFPKKQARVQRDAEILVQDRLQLGRDAVREGSVALYENLMIREGLCSPVIQCYVVPEQG